MQGRKKIKIWKEKFGRLRKTDRIGHSRILTLRKFKKVKRKHEKTLKNPSERNKIRKNRINKTQTEIFLKKTFKPKENPAWKNATKSKLMKKRKKIQKDSKNSSEKNQLEGKPERRQCRNKKTYFSRPPCTARRGPLSTDHSVAGPRSAHWDGTRRTRFLGEAGHARRFWWTAQRWPFQFPAAADAGALQTDS